MTLQTTNLDSKLKHADPIIAGILNDALSEKEIDIKDSVMLFSAKGIELELVCSVADELRKRRVGNIVTYVVNRNINFTNVCIKQCGFCAFSRDFREEEGYLLPIEEIVRRAKEAHELGATEVCIQAGLPPDMDGELYEKICREIKKEIPMLCSFLFVPILRCSHSFTTASATWKRAILDSQYKRSYQHCHWCTSLQTH